MKKKNYIYCEEIQLKNNHYIKRTISQSFVFHFVSKEKLILSKQLFFKLQSAQEIFPFDVEC